MKNRLESILALGRPGRETNRARDCINLAINFADEFGHNRLTSAHLLAGLYAERNGIAHTVLKMFGLTQHSINEQVESREQNAHPEYEIATEDFQLVFKYAFAAAKEMSHNYIGTEHLLIGTTVDGTVSIEVLDSLGLCASEIETQVYQLLGHRLS